jgi:hypothetical protein
MESINLPKGKSLDASAAPSSNPYLLSLNKMKADKLIHGSSSF